MQSLALTKETLYGSPCTELGKKTSTRLRDPASRLLFATVMYSRNLVPLLLRSIVRRGRSVHRVERASLGQLISTEPLLRLFLLRHFDHSRYYYDTRRRKQRRDVSSAANLPRLRKQRKQTTKSVEIKGE